MRSSKNRSRSKQNNRPRTLGNIINRVFDSSGPEGKVRGTPQQIIEKYQMLARDAQLSNDRVNAENCLQHAEHYTRLLAEATREQAAEQEARQQSQNGSQHGAQSGSHNGGPRERQDWRNDRDYRPEGEEEPGFAPSPDAFAVVDSEEQPIVDFPEARREDRRDRPYSDRNGGGDRPHGEFRRRDNPPRENAPRENAPRDNAPRENAPRNDRPRDDRPRDDRPRDDRPRTDRPRDDRPRDNRPQGDRPREDRREPRVIPITEATPQPELPAFITGPAPVTVMVEAPVPTALDTRADAPKPKRAPRKPKVEAPSEPSA
jgi:hypothetical protein